MGSAKPELVLLSDEVWERTWARLEGLTDDEYFWEPTPGCWSIRRRDDGTWAADGVFPSTPPAPFTTIAWRLWHLIDRYGEDRAPRWLDVPAQGPAIGLDDPSGSPPGTAADALALLDRAHARWDAHLDLVSEDQLAQPIGPVGGGYAERTRTSYVLHMLDEFVHHGAEIAVLRDLWRWQPGRLDDDPVLERIMRDDRSVLDELGDVSSAGPLVDRAAAYGRWEIVLELVRRGAPIAPSGRTPLHLAAGAGALDVVRELLELGADPAAKDPQFHATPLQWAEFLNEPAAADLLREHAAD